MTTRYSNSIKKRNVFHHCHLFYMHVNLSLVISERNIHPFICLSACENIHSFFCQLITEWKKKKKKKKKMGWRWKEASQSIAPLIPSREYCTNSFYILNCHLCGANELRQFVTVAHSSKWLNILLSVAFAVVGGTKKNKKNTHTIGEFNSDRTFELISCCQNDTILDRIFNL